MGVMKAIDLALKSNASISTSKLVNKPDWYVRVVVKPQPIVANQLLSVGSIVYLSYNPNLHLVGVFVNENLKDWLYNVSIDEVNKDFCLY